MSPAFIVPTWYEALICHQLLSPVKHALPWMSLHLNLLFKILSLKCVSVPPTLRASDEVKTLTVPVNGHLTLECLADSDPAPEIEWYKDEVKVQVQ